MFSMVCSCSHPPQCNPERVKHYKKYENTLNVKDLKLEPHVENISKHANGELHMLHFLRRHGLPLQDLLTIFKRNIWSFTEYPAPGWSRALTKHMSTLVGQLSITIVHFVTKAPNLAH